MEQEIQELPESQVLTPGSAVSTDGYQVRLEIFEGPLDLLLFLIRKKKIDIHDIPIAVITRDYLEYLEKKEQINLDREAEFLLIAALLIYIKSQMLLPREQEALQADDPRQILVDRLLEYEKVKVTCGLLREKEEDQLLRWRRTFLPPVARPEEAELLEVSLYDLAETFFLLMKKRERENLQVIRGKDVSVEEKMKEMVGYLERHGSMDFLEYFSSQDTLEEALVSFFCLLELVKNHLVVAVQEQLFQTIRVWLRRPKSQPHGHSHE
ncbi:MAG: segregation and condensation protein A [Candidatus Saccharicenans sp.]|uniref:segregation and condensation protein A n=1 Tax=Candidatus Saccharicenans sp. TaxID=2819258 RepID=UPI00404A4B68